MVQTKKNAKGGGCPPYAIRAVKLDPLFLEDMWSIHFVQLERQEVFRH